MDRTLFVGSLPPGKIDFFTAAASPTGDARSRAYQRLMDMIRECPTFDEASSFLRELDSALSQNGLHASQVMKLSDQFHRVKDLLDVDYVREKVKVQMGQSSIPGLSDLYLALERQ
jgi:hypothetical protein